ncbi:MAG: DUF4340 domain-containing protein [Pseudomonadota bacterium]
MSGHRGWLMVLLAGQLLLIGTLLLLRGAAPAEPETLFAGTVEAIVEVRISSRSDTDDRTEDISLRRSDRGWVIGDRPANATKVDELLEKLLGLGQGWPVATTDAAAERFAVTADGARKRVELIAEDGQAQTLFLGTSPGFKRLHARRADGSAIYSIALADFDVPTTPADWLDKALLAIGPGSTAAERVGAWSLRSTVDGWEIQGNDDTPALAEQASVDQWLGRFESLRVVSEVDGSRSDEQADTQAAGQAVDEFVLRAGDDELRYRLYHDTGADRYALERDDVAGRYEIASYTAEQMRSSLASFLPEAAPTADPGEEAGPAAADPNDGATP